MNLDFSMLSKPSQKHGGQMGALGTPASARFPMSPQPSPVHEKNGDRLIAMPALSPIVPSASPKTGTLKPSVSAASPLSPHVPMNNGSSDFDWQKYFDQRVGVAEHIGGMVRDKAEQQAYESCITRWLDTTPVNVPVDICPHCLHRVDPNASTAFVVNGGGHMLHHNCNTHWISRRRQEAIAELAKAGIISLCH